VLTIALALAAGCNQSAKEKSGEKNGNAGDASGTGTGTSTGSGDDESNDAYYTGIDGTNDYTLLLPNFRNLTVKDPSVATVEAVEVTLSQTTIDTLVAEQKKKNPDFEDDRFKEMLGHKQTTYKVTPLKAGRTVLQTSGGRGGEPGRKQSGWGASKNIDLIVTEYTADQLDAGKSRYTTDGGGGNLRACAECHETGKEGAPPHELGRIMELSDKDALTWITTGSVRGRTASITHTWEFGSDAEESGIVPYLRSKQTHDVETLTKLYVEEMIANGFPGGHPPPDAGKKSDDKDD
jgi:hypothetical protein